MKIKSYLTVIVIFFSWVYSASQDVNFTQWEFAPMQVNPALTGNFHGALSINLKHRNQARSILSSNAYETYFFCSESKFQKSNSSRSFNVGIFSLFDKAGTLDFQTNTYNISTSIIQKIGKSEEAHHAFGFGFNFGFAQRKIDIDDNINFYTDSQGQIIEMPDLLKSKISFADLSVGLLWKYTSKTNFSYNLGTSYQHFNSPNISMIEGGVFNLSRRINVHGIMEIPLTTKSSILPSFLFYKQNQLDQLQFGLSSKWYMNSEQIKYAEVGLFMRTTNGINGRGLGIFILSSKVKVRDIIFGFSFDRFTELGTNAFEFSLGYRLNN